MADPNQEQATNIEPAEDGESCFYITGNLTLKQINLLLKTSRALWTDNSPLNIDLSRVSRVDSAGLALMIEWTKTARQRGAEIRFYNLPEQLAAMARVSGLENVLPLFRGSVNRNTPNL